MLFQGINQHYTTKTSTRQNNTPSTPEIVNQEKSELDKRHDQLLMEALNAPLSASNETHSSSEILLKPHQQPHP